MRRLVGIACGLMATVLVPSVAFADENMTPSQPPVAGAITESTTTTIDTVHLRSGGMFRGRVTEILPGSHVTVLLTTGESRKIPWADVDRVIVASTAIPPAHAAPAASAAMVGPRAHVHIKAPHPSFLYRRAAGTTDFITACQVPCDVEMPIGDTYKIGGSGFSTTAEFKLDAPPGGSVELDVNGPNWFGIVGGGALVMGGGLTAYVGLILAASGSSCEGYSNSRSGCKDMRNVGLGALAIGAAGIAVGLLVIFPSLKTDFSQQKGSPSKDAFVRTPTWRSASVTEGSGAPTTFPLVYEGRF